MNTQIERLFAQALDLAVPETWTTLTPEQLARFKDKFAELLVKECVEIADKSNQGSKSSNEGTEFYYNADIGDKIKEHFGVRE